MNKIIAAFLICLSLLLAGCRKDPVINDPVVTSVRTPVSADLLAHFSFQPGTYWIYRDSINGRMDSFYITSNGTGLAITSYHNNEGYYYNHMQLSEHNIDGTATADSAIWQFDLHHNIFQLVEYVHRDHPELLVYPPVAGYNGVLAITPSYTLNGLSFQNVATITQGTDLFFLNDSVGIIKMRLDQSDTAMPSHVWELKRWKMAK